MDAARVYENCVHVTSQGLPTLPREGRHKVRSQRGVTRTGTTVTRELGRPKKWHVLTSRFGGVNWAAQKSRGGRPKTAGARQQSHTSVAEGALRRDELRQPFRRCSMRGARPPTPGPHSADGTTTARDDASWHLSEHRTRTYGSRLTRRARGGARPPSDLRTSRRKVVAPPAAAPRGLGIELGLAFLAELVGRRHEEMERAREPEAAGPSRPTTSASGRAPRAPASRPKLAPNSPRPRR